MSDLLQVSDLEKAKLHDTFHSEVITGKVGGLAGGADIDYATNAVTSQAQKTLPKIINDLDWSPVGKFVDGVTFTKTSDFALDGDNTQWVYIGAAAFPVTVAAGFNPVGNADYQVIHVTDHNQTTNRNPADGSAHNANDIGLSHGGTIQDAITFVTPEMFTGTDSSKLQAAADYAVANGLELRSDVSNSYDLDVQVNLVGVKGLFLDCNITYSDQNIIPLIVGADSAARFDYDIKVRSVVWSGATGAGPTRTLPNQPCLRVVGLKNANLHIGNIDYVQLYADSDSEATTSIAYNNVYPQQIELLEFNTNPSPEGTRVQWINENKFRGGRIRRIRLAGTYGHNHNKFYDPTIETDGYVNFEVGESNRIYGARFEGGGIAVNFGAGTSNNVVLRSWTNTPRDSVNTSIGSDITVTDFGIGNLALRDQSSYYDQNVMLNVTAGRKPFVSGVNPLALTKSGIGWLIQSSTNLFTSNLVKCTSGMGFDIRSDQEIWTCFIKFYDDSGVQITSLADPLLLSSGSFAWDSGTNQYSRVTKFSNILSPPQVQTSIGYVKIEVTSGGGTGTTVFNSLIVMCLTPKGRGYVSQASSEMLPMFSEKARSSSISGALLAANTSRSVSNAWAGLKANTVISCSFGSEGTAPSELICKASCAVDGVVVVTVINTAAIGSTPSGSLRVHMVAHSAANDIGTLAPV